MPRLTLAQATTIIDKALGKGAFAREDGAGILRQQIATGKAWGALGMGFGSRTLAKRAASRATPPTRTRPARWRESRPPG